MSGSFSPNPWFRSTALQGFAQKPYGQTTTGDTWDWNVEKIWLKK